MTCYIRKNSNGMCVEFENNFLINEDEDRENRLSTGMHINRVTCVGRSLQALVISPSLVCVLSATTSFNLRHSHATPGDEWMCSTEELHKV